MYDIIHFNSLNSTSVWAKENLEKLKDFSVVSCNLQTMGHGQFERKWYSSRQNGGNIYISIVLKPKNITRLDELTRYVALIGAKTIESYGLEPKFKFPNDILIEGKKIAGFLAESVFIGSDCLGVVVGVGINLNLDKDELSNIEIPATSIFNETNKHVDKNEFLKKFLDNFKDEYDEFIVNGIKGEILC